jgi:hypothetical protein
MASRKPLLLSLLALAGLMAVAQGCRRRSSPSAPSTESPPAALAAPEPAPIAEPPAAAAAAPPAADPDPCATVCWRANQLGCHKSLADCHKGCAGALADKGCAAARRAFGRCLVKEPRAHWACDEDGMPALADGFCAPERSALGACLKSQVR